MLVTKSVFVVLSSITLISAWDITSIGEGTPREYHSSGRGTGMCANRNHRKEDHLIFTRDSGSSCCLHLYKESDCSLNLANSEKGESLCRNVKNKEIDFHFRSYYVDCDNRGINNPTPLQNGGGDVYTPGTPYGPQYGSQPPPYQPPPYQAPYGSQPPPYNQPPPYPYNQPPPPYPYNQPAPYPYNQPPPYPPYCRPGDRC